MLNKWYILWWCSKLWSWGECSGVFFWSCIWWKVRLIFLSFPPVQLHFTVSVNITKQWKKKQNKQKNKQKQNEKQAVTCEKCSKESSSVHPSAGSDSPVGTAIFIPSNGVYFLGEIIVKRVTGGFFHVPLACGFGERGIFLRTFSNRARNQGKSRTHDLRKREDRSVHPGHTQPVSDTQDAGEIARSHRSDFGNNFGAV